MSSARTLPSSRPLTRQGRGAEQLDHPVAALEAGRDRHGGERGRHHGEREHARRQDVDGPVAVEVDPDASRGGDAADQHDHRDDDGEQQLLAVAEHQPRLHARLGGDHPRQGSAAGRGCEGARTGVRHGASSPSGEVEEDVLERALAEREGLRQHVVLLAPPRDPTEGGAVGRAVDQHADLVELADLGARPELGAQRLGRAVGERPVDDEADRGRAPAAGQLRRRTAGDDGAAVDDVDPVGEVLGLVHVVRGEHDRHAVRADLLEQLPGRTPCLGVHARGRLVDEDQLRAPDQGDRQPEALLLPAREAAVGRPAAVAQAEPLARASPCRGGGRAGRPCARASPSLVRRSRRRRPAASRRSGGAGRRGRAAGRGRAPGRCPAAGRDSPRRSPGSWSSPRRWDRAPP